MNRIESGVVQFGEDWPGLFLRGDDSLNFAQHLRVALEVLRGLDHSAINLAVLDGLQNDLSSVAHPKAPALRLKSAADCLGDPE